MQYLASFFNYKKPVQTYKYGWRRDLPDRRDRMFEVSIQNELPTRVDLREKCPSVYDQGRLGSCTANAIACAIQYDEMKQSLESQETPSRLFIYYNERDMEENVDRDSGASLRDGMKSINRVGYCRESDWPYIIDEFKTTPPTSCYDYASHHKSISYRTVSQTESDIKAVLNMGFPIVFGISVYESFESDEVTKTGIVPMPGDNESVLGGHAITLVGYDDDKKLFTFRNSWGESWGDKGYGYIPYEYVCDENLADDFWVLTLVM
jgi:C1A family cysteine protease